jgi:hypothetical protein
MTNSIQKNSSTVTCKCDADLAEIKRVSQENAKLFHAVVDGLNNLSDKLIRLDLHLKKKLCEDGFNHKTEA